MEEIEQRRVAQINAMTGSLAGCDCVDCLNRGFFARLDSDGHRISVPCKCMAIRNSLRYIQKSGLADLLQHYTFARWQQKEAWQKQAFRAALEYLENPAGQWFMMTGRPGSGKTHLCTALCGALMERGKPVRYMLWRDVSVKAKAAVNDETAYKALVGPLKTVPVLYIDDLFKAGRDDRGKPKITPGDVNLAFEILNARYNDKRLLTVISSELSVNAMLDIDEGVGSRIRERTREFYIQLGGKVENWRLI